jgi:hypothetical protein
MDQNIHGVTLACDELPNFKASYEILNLSPIRAGTFRRQRPAI